MSQSNKEANIILALQTYQNYPELGLHHAAEIYQASYLLSVHKPQSRTPPHMALVMTTVQAGYGKVVQCSNSAKTSYKFFKVINEFSANSRRYTCYQHVC
jgi:hypothetical protein